MDKLTQPQIKSPGGPGRSRARGSHRSGRAQFRHPAPRATALHRDGRCCVQPERAAVGSSKTAG